MYPLYVKFKLFIQIFLYQFNEAIFVTKNQYRLRLLHSYEADNNQVIGIIQVVIKRVKAKFSLRYLACNPKILNDIHPVEVCKIAFIANTENYINYDQVPEYIKSSVVPFSVIKQQPTLKISSQSFDNNETTFTIEDLNSKYKNTLTAGALAQNYTLLYSLGSQESARVGVAASNDFLNQLDINKKEERNIEICCPPNFRYYHILCISYITLILTGISIVRRMFPFQIPFTDTIIPFGGGIIFFPITFCIQDITTEVYGFRAARQMIILSIFSILFYVFYSQLVIHLPTTSGAVYQDNLAFTTVFNTQPRQVIALLVSLYIGSIINDFFVSKSKVILAGQYLWARILGSTMIGEAVLQIIGGIIGFSDKLDFKTQLLPNMILAYGYKILWCTATIPLIYSITKFLKKKEGIDVFDYNVNYSPLQFKFALKKN